MKSIEREHWWQERARWIRSRPSAAGLELLAAAVLRGSSVVRVRRLGGGLATATSVVTLSSPRGKTFDVVMKRFPRPRDPYAENEWKRLRYARRLRVPTPEPIAFDKQGEWFGVPTIVMSKLPGRPGVSPTDFVSWLEEFASVQATIHSASTGRVPSYLRGRDLKAQFVTDLPLSPVVQAAVRYIDKRFDRARESDLVVGHGDAHPGNVLWSRGRISGVTDWHHLGIYPRGHEVAYSRADIAVLVGRRYADAYLDIYERTTGARVRDLQMWDLRQGLAALRFGPLWAIAYGEQGSALTPSLARRRALAFLRSVLKTI
jgi:aminoglycoside phosphotransferase